MKYHQMDGMMYNTCYEVKNENLNDAIVGVRKDRSCRDNIFVLGAGNNSVINGDCKPIQVQTMF